MINDWSLMKKLIWLRGSPISGGGAWTTISGAIVEFITQRAHKLKSCVVTLEPKQDLSNGDPSPTNICPISGWTGVSVWRTGKNLFDLSSVVPSVYGMAVTVDGYTVKVDGTSSATGRGTIAEFYFSKVGTYHLHSSGDFLWLKGWSSLGSDVTVTVDDLSVAYRLSTATLASGTVYHLTATDIQIEIGSSFTTYEPFRGNSYSVTWEDEVGAVYGGTLTVNEAGSGKLEVNTLMLTDNGDSNLWTFTISGGSPFVYMSTPQEAKTAQTVICNLYKGKQNSSYINLNNCELAMTPSPFNFINIRDDALNSLSDFEALIQNTPIQLLFTLSTPVTYQLTQSQVITALKGYNAIWSDGGDIEVTVHGTPVEVETLQALNMLLGGAYHNDQTADDVSDDEALDIILGGENK